VQAARQARDERNHEAGRGLEDPFDEVWVVFDTEGPQNHQRIKQARDAIESARQLGMLRAVSNPSFEYWLLLHFEWSVYQFLNGDAVCRKLKDHIADYTKSRDIYARTKEHTQTAIEHSRRVFRERCPGEHSHPCDCHPCTEVHKLIESLLGET
jgi:hypothetical protein